MVLFRPAHDLLRIVDESDRVCAGVERCLLGKLGEQPRFKEMVGHHDEERFIVSEH